MSTEKFLFWTFWRWGIRSFFDPQRWCKMIFLLAWNTIFSDSWKPLVLNFLDKENTIFFDPKNWCNMLFYLAWNSIFTDYLNVLVFNLSEMENTVFFEHKNLIERWYLLTIFELFIKLQDLENMVADAVSIITSKDDLAKENAEIKQVLKENG